MLHLVKENKNLTETIQTIFQLFPEGVIIQQLEKDNKLVLKYMNNTAREYVLQADSTGSMLDVYDSPKQVRIANQEDALHSSSLSTFLKHQCHKLDQTRDTKKAINSMISLFNESRMDSYFNDSQEEESKYFTVKTMKVLWNKNSESYMHIFVDSTHVKKLEQEQARSSCQKVMFASVSHEFRTPLNAFENSLNLIKMQFDEVLDDAGPFLNQETRLRVDEHTARIEKFLKMGTISSRLLMNLVEDILDLEKFDSGVFALNIGSFKLGELIQDILYIFEEQCHERGFYFEVLPENESLLDRFFVSDQGRIRQVLINLISNAVKFTHAGGIQVILEQKKSAKGIQLWFSVKDSGVGINKKKANLFQMFRMVQAHRKEINQHGTGIGLHISKKIVESLGGEIDYESEESVGSIFSFCITPHANPALPSPTSLTLPSEFLSESILPINPHFKDPNRSKFLC